MVTIETELIEGKKDERGRRITPRVEREAWVRAYRESGLTQRAFAEKEKIGYATFVSWVQASSRASAGKPAVQFAEVRAAPTAERSGLEAQLPNGDPKGSCLDS